MSPKLKISRTTKSGKAARQGGILISYKKCPAKDASRAFIAPNLKIHSTLKSSKLARRGGIRVMCKKRPANADLQNVRATLHHLCIKCGVYPQSQRSNVRQGQCCNMCPDHGPWCTSRDGSVEVPSSSEQNSREASAQPLAVMSQQLCVKCHVFPANWRHNVVRGQCCNSCPNHGPLCTRNDWSTAVSRGCPMSTAIFHPREVTQGKAHLAAEGWVVFGPIFDSDFEHLQNLFWQDVSAIPGYPVSSPLDRLDLLPNGTCGYLVRGNNLPNGRFAWTVRLNQHIRKIFASIYEEKPDTMCTSMDAIFLAVKSRAVHGLPLHRDAEAEDMWCSFSKATLSIQGIFSLTPTSSGDDGGTVLVPKSHLRIDQRWGRKVPLDEQMRLHAACIRPTVPENHLLLFNSRTIHGSTPPLRDRPDGINRLAVAVQFMPKRRRSAETLQRKRAAYLERNGSRAKPDDQFRTMQPDCHELAWSSQHGYPHRKCRLQSRLVKGRIPKEINAIL